MRQNITITGEDLPVDPQYIAGLRDLGLEVINVSKWFNGALVSSDDSLLIDTLDRYAFIRSKPVLVKPALSEKAAIPIPDKTISTDVPPYGYSSNQIEMVNGWFLHRNQYEGQDMMIAVLDAGFTNADRISSLQHIRNEERIVAVKDFVKDGQSVFASHRHGTLVFSIMGGVVENTIYGTAPGAAYALIRTEDTGSEYLIEEYNWVCGAEYADSLGADVINSSLGYYLFDDQDQDHSFSDLNGSVTPVSIGAGIASSKGMIVVTSAGNTGDDPWLRIIAPGDAFNVLTVGAVDSEKNLAVFSARGPSSDGRVKPDICARGLGTFTQLPDGRIAGCDGTSCSAPVISGMVACLWQSNRNASALEVMESVRKSSSQYLFPDSLYGYGIPDFMLADRYLKGISPPTE
ncbi:MAG: S8 family serine peptidase, partial [Bacteroidales bacterium]